MGDAQEIVENLILELRRGTLVLSVLSQLSHPKYGYALVQSLAQKGVSIEAGTLYPLLRRLEKQDILKSEWETSGSKPRKYYVLSDTGWKVYKSLCAEWKDMVGWMDALLGDGGVNHGG